jgi:hypothetical protein
MVYIHNDSFPIKSAFLPSFRIRKRFHSDFWFIFTTDGEYLLSIYLLIAIFSDWKHRWRNTIYIQEIEIRSYVISLGDDDFIFSAQNIFVTYLRNTKNMGTNRLIEKSRSCTIVNRVFWFVNDSVTSSCTIILRIRTLFLDGKPQLLLIKEVPFLCCISLMVYDPKRSLI